MSASTKCCTAATLPAGTVIISSRNRPRLLYDTVSSILKGDALPAELVIVDQSDSANSKLAEIVEYSGCHVRYLWSQTRGLSRGRNLGIMTASHEVIICLDDDMLVAENWYRTLVHALVNAGSDAVVTGQVLPGAAETAGGFAPALATSAKPAVYKGRLNTDVLAGGHMATYRPVLNYVGGFDERLGAGAAFPAADDNDLGFRILDSGYRIIYVPEAIVIHRAWRNAKDYAGIRWNYGLGKGGFYAKHFSLRDPHMLVRLVKDIGRRLWWFPARVRGDRRLLVGDPLYITGVLVGAARWCAVERPGRAQSSPLC